MKPSRRRFLQTSLQTVAVAPLFAGLGASTSFAAEKSKSGNIKFDLGLASYTTRKFDQAKTIAMAHRAGLKFMCFKDFHLKLTATDEECRAAAEECQKAGMKLYAGGVITMKKPEDVENAFRYAKACGMTTIVGVPMPEILELVDKKVKETGIFVAIHNHGPGDKLYPTPEAIMEKIEKLDKRIGLCIDVGHTERIGADVIEAFKKYADRLHDVHFKDETEKTPKGQTCICGRGVLDIPGYVAALVEIGYDKVVSFEYEAEADDPLPGLMESIGYVRGIMRMTGGSTIGKGDPNYFEKTLREWCRRMFEEIPEEDRNDMTIDQGVDKAMLMMKDEEPDLFAASPELIDSFKNKTYDAASTKAIIKEYVKIFKDFDVALSLILVYCLKRFEKGDMNDTELELARRLLKKTVDNLKTELK